MKLSARNFGTFLVLAIAIVGVVFISGCMGKVNKGGATGLPVYPGAKETNQHGAWATGFSDRFSEVHGYVVEGASPSDIIEWYKSKLSGYTVVTENTTDNGALLIMQKGNTMIGISAVNEGNETVFLVGKSIVPPEGGIGGTQLPSHDLVSGEEPIARYPGSVMLDYTKEGGFPITYSITYGTKDSYNKVIDWYKSTLQSNGWSITFDDEEEDEAEINFQKGDNDVTIFIYPPQSGTPYTEIDVSYADRSMPSHDLVSGEEPIARYPGSVMIEYHKGSIIYQGQTTNGVKIVYLAPGKADEVSQWYSDKLKTMFSNVITGSEAGSEGETGGLLAIGELNGQQVTVIIEFEEHVEYTKVSLTYLIQG